jgi:fatty-acyl-CoA synthase
MQVPDRNLFEHLAASAAIVPNKTAIDFYGHSMHYADLHDSALRLAGYLQQHLGVRKGERVLLQMQNCPQFVIAYFAVLRADAVVVALNPMCTPEEVAYYAEDCGARVLVTMQDHLAGALPLLRTGQFSGCVVGSYGDFAGSAADVPWLSIPPFVYAPRALPTEPGVHDFLDCLAAGIEPGPLRAQGPDLAVLGYTSGTTGKPKGAMLSHRALAHSVVPRARWHEDGTEHVELLVLPLSHLAATQSMHMAILGGSSIVLLARWDAGNALALIEQRRVTSMAMVTPMLIDFMAHPAQPGADLSSVRRLFCAATATPEAVSTAVEKRLNLK